MKFTGFSDADIKDIEGALEQAFHESLELFGRKLTEAITDNVWQWPTGDTPRDIVEQGGLRDSQSLSFPNQFSAEFSYSVDYAAAVHEGATLKNGTTLPPRRWTDKAFDDFNLLDAFSKLFQQYSGLTQT